METKRVSRRLALAEALGADYDSVESYQPGHHDVPHFTAGGDVYAVAKDDEWSRSTMRGGHDSNRSGTCGSHFVRVDVPDFLLPRVGGWCIFRRR